MGLRVTFVFDAFETAMELLEISACCEPAVRTAAIYQLSQLCMWLTWLSTSKVIEVSMAIFTIKKLFSASLYTKQRAEQVSLICWAFFLQNFPILYILPVSARNLLGMLLNCYTMNFLTFCIYNAATFRQIRLFFVKRFFFR